MTDDVLPRQNGGKALSKWTSFCGLSSLPPTRYRLDRITENQMDSCNFANRLVGRMMTTLSCRVQGEGERGGKRKLTA